MQKAERGRRGGENLGKNEHGGEGRAPVPLWGWQTNRSDEKKKKLTIEKGPNEGKIRAKNQERREAISKNARR